jgi:SAM-dependent methyltransferase/tetratricopeptide (TPR) repeat protein
MRDYADVLDKYWQRLEKVRESSLSDLSLFARQVLTTAGPGRLLDVGSGAGILVQELLNRGADAYGVDVSKVAVDRCSRHAPGRFFTGSVLALPFPDASFDTIVSTNCLDHLAPEDVGPALREMRRVCRRNVLLRIATGPGSAGLRALTMEKRGWWENAAFAAGFRKHPQYYAITPFPDLEVEGNTVIIPLEKIPDEALALYPLDRLLEHRELHMDMSRETGRRSDAHMARYHLAANYIREGDMVLDSACGMGYGSRLMAWQGSASRVIGADLDTAAIRYSNDTFAAIDERLSFQVADVQNLHSLPDNSIDLFVSFETLEHVPHPERLIAEARRILRPGGRFIVSVPNLWVNEEGVDPNPHHLHVYDWKRLSEEIRSGFLLEVAYAQTAGGGMKLTAHPRSLVEFSPDEEPPAEAEWWLAVAMKDPVNSKDVPYLETAFHWNGDPPNAVAFARDYENPWLIRGLVSTGWRNRNPIQRESLASRVLTVSSPSSPDTGAALCVLAYRMLESSEGPIPESVSAIIRQIDSYIAQDDPRPQCRRWAISLLYVRGRLWQAIGDLEKAFESYRDCSSADPLVYSPLLATKTVDACRLAGVLQFQRGDKEQAREYWMRGISHAERALKGDWREIHGDTARPFTFGLREAAHILDTASRCADGLHHLNTNASGRGLSDGSFVERISVLESSVRSFGQLQASSNMRLQRALGERPRSVKGLVRIGYLLALILLPARVKTLLRPLASALRRRFQ